MAEIVTYGVVDGRTWMSATSQVQDDRALRVGELSRSGGPRLRSLPVDVPPLPHLPPTWTNAAACIGRWELFDAPADSSEAAEAARLCQGCPVRRTCAEYTAEIKPDVGVWAGKEYGIPAQHLCPQELHDMRFARVDRPRKGRADRVVCRHCERAYQKALYERKRDEKAA